MNPTEYQKLAARTECTQARSADRITGGCCSIKESSPNSYPGLMKIRLNHSVIGMTGELGEIGDVLTADNPDLRKLELEFGDFLWYVAQACNALGFDLRNVVDTRMPATSPETVGGMILVLTRAVGNLASELQRLVYYGKYDGAGKSADLFVNFRNALRQVVGTVWAVLPGVGLVPETVMHNNIEKLKVRYPEKYTDWNAADENRDRVKEESVGKWDHPDTPPGDRSGS